MMIYVGTSGYNYPEWKGSFYPEDLPSAKMLLYYADRFQTVEINYTFYRFPNEKTLSGWAAATPDDFKLTLKAPRRITHDARLRNVGELTRSFCDLAGTLGPKLGALLFQLPPSYKKDVAALEGFLAGLPKNAPAAFEFRHPSWHHEEVWEALRSRGKAVCVADTDRLSTPVVTTAEFAYFRLRDEGYTDEDIARWAATIGGVAGRCPTIYVYFKHEEQGKGPEFAKKLIDLLAART
ncbi:MAG: DUF72 domain-containing protein [Acidobacteria bacterium]|nr:DUF72 domain-containing protein [Acidobacteriota bacterium]